MSGRLAYVQSGSRIHVIRFDGAASPREIGVVDLEVPYASRFTVAGRGDVLYVGLWAGELVVIDVSDPAQPRIRKRVASPAGTFDLVLGMEHAYAIGVRGLAVVDIHDPWSPIQLGTMDMSGNVIAISSEHLIASGDETTIVVEVSEPTTPVQIAELDNAGYARGISVDEPWVYILQTETVHVLDVVNPAQPRFVGQLNLDDYATEIRLGRHGLLAATYRSLSLYPGHCH